MSRTTPRSYYHAFVEPNYIEFLCHSNNVRCAFNASIPAAQLADIMWSYYRRNDQTKIAGWSTKKAFLADLSKREPSFQTIYSVATVYKHLHARESFHVCDTAGDIATLSVPGELEILSYSPGGEASVTVRRRDLNARVSLSEALDAVVKRLWPVVLPEE